MITVKVNTVTLCFRPLNADIIDSALLRYCEFTHRLKTVTSRCYQLVIGATVCRIATEWRWY